MSCKKSGGPAIAAALLLVLGAFLSGCEDDVAAPTVAADPTVKVMITVTQVHVIAECEGTTGTNPGDFVFELAFYTSDSSIEETLYSGSFSGLNGQDVDIADIEIELNRVPPDDGRLYMEFRVTELDNGIPDSGMNDARSIGDYLWPTGDTLEENFTQRVAGSTRCEVMFVYTLSAERMSAR